MPLFEYICEECSHHFESIVQSSTVPTCPICRTQNIEKQLSAFAVGGGMTDGGFTRGAERLRNIWRSERTRSLLNELMMMSRVTPRDSDSLKQVFKK